MEQNGVNARDTLWRRFEGDDWACYDALPPEVRQRLQDHAYDAWSVNTLKLWRHFRRKRGHSVPALNSILRHMDTCERLERAAFAAQYRREAGTELPHVAAGVAVQRSGVTT